MIGMLKNRRSVRSFEDVKISPELLETLLTAVLTAPSGHGIKHVEFILVDDRDILARLSTVKAHGAAFLKEAPQAIAVIADESKTDVWIEDASIAATVVQLTAESLGMGSCWVQIRQRKDHDGNFSEELAKEILEIEDEKRIECLIALGYSKERRIPHDVGSGDFKRVRHNSYSKLLFDRKD